jgi:hypothetical protein
LWLIYFITAYIQATTKTKKRFTKKYLEFFCYNEDELIDSSFINFIEVLKRIGFNSDNNNSTITYSKIIDDEEECRYRIF